MTNNKVLFLDNNIIGMLRSKTDTYNIEFLEAFKSFYATNVFSKIYISNKLFLEIIHEGKIREKTKKSLLKEERTKLFAQENIGIQDIVHYYDYLEKFWTEVFKESLSLDQITLKADKVLKKYRFHQDALMVHQAVQDFVQELKCNDGYLKFIDCIVVDSVLRGFYELIKDNALNHKKISIEDSFKIKAMKALQEKYKTKLLYYYKSEIFLFIVAMKWEVDSQAIIDTYADMVDTELYSIFFYGININNDYVPATILTKDSKEKVIQRINYTLKSITEFIKIYGDNFSINNIGKLQVIDSDTLSFVNLTLP
jgi:hypothetical protein